MPTLAPSHRSKPVRGSVLVAVGLLTVEDEEVVATDVEPVPEGTAGALEAWPAVDGAGVEAGVELDCDDVVVVFFEPDPLDPPSGSVYCWSPADGPDASAAAGATHAKAIRTSIEVTVRRRRRTARVLQAAKIVACARRRAAGVRARAQGLQRELLAGRQNARLQVLLHDEERDARTRRGVLG